MFVVVCVVGFVGFFPWGVFWCVVVGLGCFFWGLWYWVLWFVFCVILLLWLWFSLFVFCWCFLFFILYFFVWVGWVWLLGVVWWLWLWGPGVGGGVGLGGGGEEWGVVGVWCVVWVGGGGVWCGGCWLVRGCAGCGGGGGVGGCGGGGLGLWVVGGVLCAVIARDICFGVFFVCGVFVFWFFGLLVFCVVVCGFEFGVCSAFSAGRFYGVCLRVFSLGAGAFSAFPPRPWSAIVYVAYVRLCWLVCAFCSGPVFCRVFFRLLPRLFSCFLVAWLVSWGLAFFGFLRVCLGPIGVRFCFALAGFACWGVSPWALHGARASLPGRPARPPAAGLALCGAF